MKNKSIPNLDRRPTVLWLIGTVFVILAGSGLTAAIVQASQTPKVSAHTYEQAAVAGEPQSSSVGFDFTSEPMQSDQPITAVGFTWNEPADTSFDIQSMSNGQWSDWSTIAASTDIQPADANRHTTDLFFFNPTATFRYRIHSVIEPVNLRIITLSDSQIHSVGGLFQNITNRLIPRATASTTVISRAQWGADESISTWQPEYADPKKFVIHHTAGSDGGSDPAATIRAIQYWHAVVNGWGDIGYNYLVDASGRIYEGRKGGDAVIGAHAYREPACNQQRFGGGNVGVNFNVGTIGIAVLGDYQNNSLPQPVLDGLENFIAEKSAQHSIQPAGTADFLGMTALPNIVGHGDIDCTLCPGQNFTPLLAQVRSASQTLYDNGSFQITQNVRLDAVSESSFDLERGQTKTIHATVSNIGNVPWHSFDQPTWSIRPVKIPSAVAASNWPDAHTAGRLTAAAVAPGDSVIIDFTVTAPSDRMNVDEEFQLALGDELFTGTTFTIHMNVTGLDRAARLISKTVPVATLVKQRPKMELRFTNLGKITWTPRNTHLKIFDLNGRPSQYTDRNWPDSAGKIKLKEANVATGQTGTFEFYETSPATSGLYKQVFSLYTDNQLVINSTTELISRADPTYRAELVSATVPVATRVGWTPTVTVKIKNVGIAAWDSSTRLRIYDANGRVSPFRDAGWNSSSGDIKLKEKTVRPGGVGTFTFRLKPSRAGLYLAEFRLATPASPEPVSGSFFARKVRVDPK